MMNQPELFESVFPTEDCRYLFDPEQIALANDLLKIDPSGIYELEYYGHLLETFGPIETWTEQFDQLLAVEGTKELLKVKFGLLVSYTKKYSHHLFRIKERLRLNLYRLETSKNSLCDKPIPSLYPYTDTKDILESVMECHTLVDRYVKDPYSVRIEDVMKLIDGLGISRKSIKEVSVERMGKLATRLFMRRLDLLNGWKATTLESTLFQDTWKTEDASKRGWTNVTLRKIHLDLVKIIDLELALSQKVNRRLVGIVHPTDQRKQAEHLRVRKLIKKVSRGYTRIVKHIGAGVSHSVIPLSLKKV